MLGCGVSFASAGSGSPLVPPPLQPAAATMNASTQDSRLAFIQIPSRVQRRPFDVKRAPTLTRIPSLQRRHSKRSENNRTRSLLRCLS
jgi:hypothetical protein